MAVRNQAVAGAFYPSDRQELSLMIESFLKKSSGKLPAGANRLENLHGLIVPHAGYQFSGSTAGKAYRLILGKKFTRVIILCPNHTLFLNRIAVDTNNSWRTPLGEVKVDRESCSKLDSDLFVPGESSHLREHAIEVQIPFLQKILPDFKIVPLVVGTIHGDTAERAAHEILKIVNHETLLIISTDLSHFLSVREAEKKDSESIKNILSLDSDSDVDACGAYSLSILKEICRIKKWTPKLVEYTNSGKVTGDNSKVVGYASFWF
jgi:MEMO1 family protein